MRITLNTAERGNMHLFLCMAQVSVLVEVILSALRNGEHLL